MPNGYILERIEDDWDGRARTIVPHPVQKDGYLAVRTRRASAADIDEDFVAAHPSEANISIPVTESSGSYAPGTFGEHVYVQPP